MNTMTSTPAPQTHESAPVRDLATERGYYTTIRTTIGKYLGDLGLYHSSTRSVRWDASIVHVDFQRAAIGIKKNSVKRTMLRDVMRGGTVPPVCLAEVSKQARNLIIDGLQRTHVEATGLKSLIAKENGDDVEPFIQEELEKIATLGQSPLSVDGFLARPFEYQLWRDLNSDEIVRLFIVLNAGQQKVTPRHLLEVMGAQLRQMFSSWGLSNMTDRERREQQGRRGPDRQVEGVNVYRYEYLLDGLIAYLGRDPHVKTSQVLQGLASDGKLSVKDASIEERITDIGAAECRSDLVWVFRDLNEAMAVKYGDLPQWEHAIMAADTFTFPLLAALGTARDYQPARAALEDRKAKLLQLLSGPSDDPLALTGEGPDSLGTIQSSISSNIGRRRRSIVFGAFRRYFRTGPDRQDYPLDWALAQHD